MKSKAIIATTTKCGKPMGEAEILMEVTGTKNEVKDIIATELISLSQSLEDNGHTVIAKEKGLSGTKTVQSKKGKNKKMRVTIMVIGNGEFNEIFGRDINPEEKTKSTLETLVENLNLDEKVEKAKEAYTQSLELLTSMVNEALAAGEEKMKDIPVDKLKKKGKKLVKQTAETLIKQLKKYT